HAFRPYNYQHVFSQSQQAAAWGMPSVLPYSQQFWHRYEGMVDLSRGDHSPVTPYVAPVPEWNHYPTPLTPGTSQIRDSAIPRTDGLFESPVLPVQALGPSLPPL